MGNSAKAKSIGRLVLQLALGAMLIVGGIWAMQGGGDFGAKALASWLGKTFGVIFGVIELVAGVLLVIECFTKDIFGKFDNILGLIIMIVWLIAIVVADIIKGDFSPFLPWLYNFASHVIILGALWSLND
jgi:hypothetical protein